MVLSCCLPALKPELHELVQLSLNYHLLLHYRRKNQKNMMFPCWQDSADFEHYIPLDLSVDLNPTKMKTCMLPQVRIKSKWTQYTSLTGSQKASQCSTIYMVKNQYIKWWSSQRCCLHHLTRSSTHLWNKSLKLTSTRISNLCSWGRYFGTWSTQFMAVPIKPSCSPVLVLPHSEVGNGERMKLWQTINTDIKG